MDKKTKKKVKKVAKKAKKKVIKYAKKEPKKFAITVVVLFIVLAIVLGCLYFFGPLNDIVDGYFQNNLTSSQLVSSVEPLMSKDTRFLLQRVSNETSPQA